MAEFTTLAKNTPADVLILDVRNPMKPRKA